MNDTESLITLTAAILLTRRTQMESPDMLKEQIETAVQTARQIHTVAKSVVSADLARAAQVVARANQR